MTELSGYARNEESAGEPHVHLDANGTMPASAGDDQISKVESIRAPSSSKARKRTKTGCLTCRKRRIKCGEERPTCKNCVKSKRECEGYVPRVIFKDPLGAFRPGQHGIAARTQHIPGHHSSAGMYGGSSSASVDTPIAPRLQSYMEGPAFPSIQVAAAQNAQGGLYSTLSNMYGNHAFPINLAADGQQYLQQEQYSPIEYQNVPNAETFAGTFSNAVLQSSAPHPIAGENHSEAETTHPSISGTHWNLLDHMAVQSDEHPTPTLPNSSRIHIAQDHDNYQWIQQPELPSLMRRPLTLPPSQGYLRYGQGFAQDLNNHQIQPQDQHYEPPLPSSRLSAQQNHPEYDDSDADDDPARTVLINSQDFSFGPMIALSAGQPLNGARSMTNFLNQPNVLATYHPDHVASPLTDPQTARVFCHFITATAPTLAVCERHPSNPAVIFSGTPVPRSQQALWSYTLPMLAMTHQGLLHAMLALGSLHISKLQHSSPTPSLKHYHYALRRIGKALRDHKKRKNVATLAATLLLGFYEVTTAEHNKWNSHLSGARELITEIDFASMARRIERHRCRQEEAEAKSKYQMFDYEHGYGQAHPPKRSFDFPPRDERQLNENLISIIMGWKTSYDQYGHIVDGNQSAEANNSPVTAQDVENFEIQSDLFWWYAKQDMYQSIVSRNRLLLSYDRWAFCPPRAPIGRLNAVYGSLDHLLLLMGRLAEFSGKDMPRKLRAQKAAGSRPSPTGASQSPNQQGPLPPTPTGTQSSPMYGMIPNLNPAAVRLPPGFDQAEHDRRYKAPVPSQDKSLEIATREAEAEWTSISHAFDVLFQAFGPDYAPLSNEHHSPRSTPFGPALFYRSYAIACVMVLYHCGRIVCLRAHPSMPPAAMVAAGIAAPQTAQYANTVGRIVAGIHPPDTSVPINPHHGAALMDSCMGLFHAGIQYREQGQRGWTVTKLRDVERMTGWQTSALIASGCETAWIKAAEMGRGPPYTRPENSTAQDDRVAGRGRDPDDLKKPPKDNNDRRFITVNAGTRVYWAIGILGVEEDMKNMNLG